MYTKKMTVLPALLLLFVCAHAQHKLGLSTSDTLRCSYLNNNAFKLTIQSQAGELSSSKELPFKYEELALNDDSVKRFLLAKSFFTGPDTTLLNDNLTAITETIKAAYEDYWLSQYKPVATPDSAAVVLLKTPTTTIVLSALRSKDAGDAPTLNVYKNGKQAGTTQDVTKNTSLDVFTTVYKAKVLMQKDSVGINDSLRLKYYVDTAYATVTGYLKQNTGVTSRLGPNFDSLTYNDSLRAHLTLHKRVPVYKIDGASKTFQVTPDSITLETGQLYINEGFLYNIAFSISAADAKKFEIIPSQAFARKINLRNSLFAGFMINRPAETATPKAINTSSTDPAVKMAIRLWNVLPLETDYRQYPDTPDRPRYVIFPGDLVSFAPPRRAPNPIFTAKEAMYSYDDKDSLWNKPVAVQEKSLYSFINLDVYSDLIGLFDENKPNGLLQTELRVMFRGFRRPLGQVYPSRARATLLDKGEFFIRASKLDAKNKFLNVLHETDADGNITTRYVHGFNLLQYKSLIMGIRANVLDIEYRGGSTALVGEAGFIRTPLRDTLVSKTGDNITKTPVELGLNSRYISGGINFKFNVASFMDVDFTGRTIWLKAQGNKNIKISRDEYTDIYPDNSYIASPSAETWFLNYKGTVTINLDDDKTKRIILMVEKTREINQEGNNFWIAQVGYSADLNKFLNFNRDKDKK